MQQETFVKLSPPEVQAVLERLSSAFEGSHFNPQETVILAQNLSFYPGFKLLDIVNHSSVPPLRRFVVLSKDRYVVLNFSNEPVYALNKELPVKIDRDNVADYARFFFGAVRGENGRFIIVESVDDIPWKDDPPPTARKAIGKMITPLAIDKNDGQSFTLSTCMVFKDSLFKTKITIDSHGVVSIGNETLLVEDIPVLDDVFGQ